MRYDPYEPTHNSRYQRLYATGYDRAPADPPNCHECHEYPAILDADTDEPGLCYRCETLER